MRTEPDKFRNSNRELESDETNSKYAVLTGSKIARTMLANSKHPYVDSRRERTTSRSVVERCERERKRRTSC